MSATDKAEREQLRTQCPEPKDPQPNFLPRLRSDPTSNDGISLKRVLSRNSFYEERGQRREADQFDELNSPQT
jgi:hypothetical protein